MANSLMEAKCNAITNLKESRLGTVREKGIHNIKQKQKKIVKVSPSDSGASDSASAHP